LKGFFAYILLIVLTLQSHYCNFMDLEYRLRFSEYLTKCINKNQPALACDGQCVLMKKLEQKAQHESEKNTTGYEYSSLYVHRDYAALDIRALDIPVSKHHFAPYLVGYGIQYNALLYRPPIG